MAELAEKLFINTQEGRLDKILSSLMQDSRHQTQQLIQSQYVSIDGHIISRPSHALKGGEHIKIICPPPAQHHTFASITHQSFDVIYEDDCLLVINKPPMLVVHPAPSVKEVTLSEHLSMQGYSLSTLNGKERPGIVHRLDKETSGAIVIAKDNHTHRILSDQLANRDMGRYYLAIIDMPLKENLNYECFMGRNSRNRLKMTKVAESKGRFSKSSFVKLLTLKNDEELIAIKLQTGRTHQIRCHLEQLNRHILGDELYGFKGRWEGRILLHALGLYLIHPTTQQKLLLKAPLFSDMLRYLTQNSNAETLNEILQLPIIVSAFD